LQAEAGSNLL